MPVINMTTQKIEIIALEARQETRARRKLLECFQLQKESVIKELRRTEFLLTCIDRRMYQERNNLINLLKYVGGGIETRENSIKQSLAQIAAMEMEKGVDEDMLSAQTLKTIEIVNIADISIEKQNLERQIVSLTNKKKELELQEAAVLKEKERRDNRKRARDQA